MEEVKQDFSDLITSATEAVEQVTISSVLPSTAGTQDDKIQEINNFLKNKSRDTGARFVDNDTNFLFRDGSCDTSAFKSDGICLSANGVERLMSNLSLRHHSHRDVGTGCNTSGPQYAGCNYVATTETQTQFARYSPNWCWSPCRRWTRAYCKPV